MWSRFSRVTLSTELPELSTVTVMRQQTACMTLSCACTHTHTNTHTHYMQPSSQALRSQVAPSELGQQSVLFPGSPLPKAPETLTRPCWLWLGNTLSAGGSVLG